MEHSLSSVHEDTDGKRYYNWGDGSKHPSVTTILNADPEKKKAIADWEERHPNPIQYRDRQGQLGRLVHRRVLNQYTYRSLPPEEVRQELLDDDFLADVETAVAMWDRCPLNIGDDPHIEVAVRNDKYEYAGRFDLLTRDGLLCDLKTSRQIHQSHLFQIAAYWKALEQMDAYAAPTRGAVIKLHSNHKLNKRLVPKVVRITPQQADRLFEDFLRIMRVYRGNS